VAGTRQLTTYINSVDEGGGKPVSKTFYAPSAADIVDPRLNSILANRSQCLSLIIMYNPLSSGLMTDPIAEAVSLDDIH
jgi:hypothetical protein